MKRSIAAAAAALLLSACDTYPPGDPSGTPYPPQDPYGDPPYPPYPQDPYPYPQDPYPPTQPYPPAGPADSCANLTSRDWRAWVDMTPGADSRPTLFVTGTVVAPTGGWRMEFEPFLQEQRSYPVQLTARLRAIPPAGGATQALTTHDLRWQWPLASGPVGAVTIECGRRILATISQVQTVQ